MGIVGKMLLVLIKFLITAWDVMTNWVYSMVTNPEQKVRDHNRVLAKPQETIKENDTEVGGKLFHNLYKNILLSGYLHPHTWHKDKTDF